MHCASCEVLLERTLQKVPGIRKAHVSRDTQRAEVFYSGQVPFSAIEEAIAAKGYTAIPLTQAIKEKPNYLQLGGIAVLLLALWTVLQNFRLLPSIGIESEMSYGLVFGIGLVAAFSTCIAVTGGLLVAVSAKYQEAHANQSGYSKFVPHLYFNAGRIAFYTLFGALVGALGSAIAISPRVTGILTLVVSAVMILLGFQLLKLFPGLTSRMPAMPKWLAHRIHAVTESRKPHAPFLLGGLTFFLPCGFTQALQLYVLSRGNPVEGALVMFFFSLGTLPALLSLGALSSFSKGAFQQYFMKFAGVMVVMVGFWNVGNGLSLAGIPISLAAPAASVNISATPVTDGKQVVQMRVNGLEYSPSQFTVQKGIPVEWQIDGAGAEGCAQVITVPSLGITQYLKKDGITMVNFTPTETGAIPFSCTMGMTTRGAAFTVVEGEAPAPVPGVPTAAPAQPACDPTQMSCDGVVQEQGTEQVQKLSMEISKEKGFYPDELTVKKDIPVELTIDTQIPMRGCMSTMVIPEFEVAHLLTLGKTVLKFTPNKTGRFGITCSMGSPMAGLTVIN